jgi:hypothetical protein
MIDCGIRKESGMSGSEAKVGIKARRKRVTKRELMKRDARILERLAAGLTIQEVALGEGISPRRARERVSAFLAREAAGHPGEFIQMQIRRLSEAMLVAYSAMSGGNLKAVDRVVKIVRELDRYHGFAFARPSAPDFAPLQPPALAGPQQCEPTLNGVASN